MYRVFGYILHPHLSHLSVNVQKNDIYISFIHFFEPSEFFLWNKKIGRQMSNFDSVSFFDVPHLISFKEMKKSMLHWSYPLFLPDCATLTRVMCLSVLYVCRFVYLYHSIETKRVSRFWGFLHQSICINCPRVTKHMSVIKIYYFIKYYEIYLFIKESKFKKSKITTA